MSLEKRLSHFGLQACVTVDPDTPDQIVQLARSKLFTERDGDIRAYVAYDPSELRRRNTDDFVVYAYAGELSIYWRDYCVLLQ